MKASLSNLHHYKTFLKVKNSIRKYLDEKGYLELDLPALSPVLIPESYLEVFETELIYGGNREKLYLTPSPELFIKRLLVEGIGNCYYLGKSYRNADPRSLRHSPEFTMLEMYKVGVGYMGIADEVLGILRVLAHNMGKTDIAYKGFTVNFDEWEKLTVAEAFEKYAGIGDIFSHEHFLAEAAKRGYIMENSKGKFTYEDLFTEIYALEVEPHLGTNGQPTLLYDYPVEFASLSKPNADGKTSQRFEFYIGGLELGNCYSELADWELQEKRLKEEENLREKYGKIQHPADWGFVESLKKGLPECSGIAIGVERLAAVFADIDDINKLQLINFI